MEELDLRRRGNTGSAIQSMRESPKGYLVAIIGGRAGRGGDDDEGGGADEGRGGRTALVLGADLKGLAAYNMDDLVKVSGRGDVSPKWVWRDPKGGFGVGRIALNPNNKEVILGGNKIVMYSYPEIF